MFTLNLKKEWKMYKSLLISFFLISLGLFLVILSAYFILEYANLTAGSTSYKIIYGIWTFVAVIVTMLATILPIILMFLVLKNDLGKNNIHNTIYTPQSVISWFLPKVLFVFLIQGLFALISLGSSYLLSDISGLNFDTTEKIISFLSATFALGIFGIITISMAIFYSFRKKSISWTLIAISIVSYFVITAIPTIVKILLEGEESVNDLQVLDLLITFGVDFIVGLIFIIIALILFNKKIEY